MANELVNVVDGYLSAVHASVESIRDQVRQSDRKDVDDILAKVLDEMAIARRRLVSLGLPTYLTT